jgi:hypothetical protein
MQKSFSLHTHLQNSLSLMRKITIFLCLRLSNLAFDTIFCLRWIYWNFQGIFNLIVVLNKVADRLANFSGFSELLQIITYSCFINLARFGSSFILIYFISK